MVSAAIPWVKENKLGLRRFQVEGKKVSRIFRSMKSRDERTVSRGKESGKDRVLHFVLRVLLLGIALVSVAATSQAQVISLYDVIYRPPGENWLQVRGGDFNIIYPAEHEQQAREMMNVLRSTRPETDSFLGVEHPYTLTAILSDQSDSGNGFVTPFPYKTEINAIALRGRALSRRHQNWIQVVTAHELVHAAQAEFQVPFSMTGIARRFAPDFARALSLFKPSGVVEGMAVYRESQIPEGAGRLNHSYFLMQARAGMMERGGWSLVQALERPNYTRPFDRYYHGGSLFVDFLMQTYGHDRMLASLRWQQYLPFSGYGSNLRLALGQSPSVVEAAFRDWFLTKEGEQREKIGVLTSSHLLAKKLGRTHRRPYWHEDGSVITFALGYAMPRGFQRVSPEGRLNRIARNEITDDASFQLDSDSRFIYYSRYLEHPNAPQAKTAWAYRMNTETGDEVRLVGSGHTYNPVVIKGDRILALRSDGQFNRIVEITSGEQVTMLQEPALEIVSLAPRPGSDSLAVIAKSGPHQAAFLVKINDADWSLSPWIGFEDSSVYDGTWSSNGRFFAFTSDHTGVMNVYVLDAWKESLVQATNALYGAMEGHVTPDGKRLVFIEYGEEQFDLRTMTLDQQGVKSLNLDVANETWNTTWREDQSFIDPLPALDAEFNGARGYNPWQHLKPRMVYPTAYLDQARERDVDARLGLGLGLAMQGTDPLQRIAWYSEGIIQKNRLWGEVGIQSGAFSFRPGVKLERRPTTVDAIVQGEQGEQNIQRVIRDRISWSVSATLPHTLDQNVHRTSFIPSLSLSFRSDRFMDDDLALLQERRGRLALQPSFFFGHRMLRNSRDIWPTSGRFISWYSDIELNRDVGEKQRGSIASANVYVPFLRQSNTSIRIDAGHLFQNRVGIFGLRFFKPTGWEDARVGSGHYGRLGLRIRQPVAFPEDGWLTIPVFIRALYLKAGLETVARLEDTSNRFSTGSMGLGIKFRVWHFFDIDVSWDAAYRFQTKEWDTVWKTVSEN